ncbi:MAG: crossover junction endodeoxyribonuclease RuvC [Myxococcales bacterium]|nr:crossover junction endodeoxyribonuclease RuvC [Myxococcota bacterium]MDW8282357.1 crossover junction endodeoxyribonuclease RuvC [Myxococcales bacterium]
MRILGIDPGTRLCGYGVIEVEPAGQLRYVECGVMQLGEGRPLPMRLRQLFADLGEVVGDLQPNEVALEAIFHGKHTQAALRLGHARGVVMLLCAQAELRLFEYTPATVKRAVVGHGRASKAQVQQMVRWQCGLRSPPAPDAADALALALCHAYHRGASAWTTRNRRHT